MTKHHNATHGMYGTPTYNSWAAMKQRCYYEKHIEYPRYGAKGIKVCEKWQTFEGFFEDMGMRPEGATIERKDSRGDYEPSNCIWASKAVQANNVASNHRIEWRGRAQTLSQWAEELGFKNGGVIAKRLRRGWTVEQAMTLPAQTKVNKGGGKETQFKPVMIEYNGERKSLSEWAKQLGFANPSALSKRLRRGLSLDLVLSPPERKRRKG